MCEKCHEFGIYLNVEELSAFAYVTKCSISDVKDVLDFLTEKSRKSELNDIYFEHLYSEAITKFKGNKIHLFLILMGKIYEMGKTVEILQELKKELEKLKVNNRKDEDNIVRGG